MEERGFLCHVNSAGSSCFSVSHGRVVLFGLCFIYCRVPTSHCQSQPFSESRDGKFLKLWEEEIRCDVEAYGCFKVACVGLARVIFSVSRCHLVTNQIEGIMAERACRESYRDFIILYWFCVLIVLTC